MKCDSLILGKIIPVDVDLKSAEAIASKDGIIVYVGSKEIAEKLCDKDTKVYDYGDNYIYPGFFDSHCHGLYASQRMKFQCNLTSGKSMQDYVDLMTKYIKDNPGRDVYLGAGWVKHEIPTKEMLDAIDTDKAIALTSADGHSVWANSKAIEVAGLTKEKCKELGYDIARVNENGEPTGWVSEKAILVFNNAFLPSKEQIKEGLLAWQDFAFKNGMTTVVEAHADYFPEALNAYQELVNEGKWKLRTYAYPAHSDLYPQGGKAVAEAVLKDTKIYDSEYFKVIGTKMFMDGVVEAHTAYLLDEYADKPGDFGVFNFKGREKLMDEIALESNKIGLPVHIHAIGDAAVRTAVDTIEKSQFSNCNFDIRNNIVHLQLIQPEDVKRLADLNIGAIVAPLWVPKQADYFDNECSYLGVDRAYSEYPIKTFVDHGATIGFHSDYPVTAIINKPLEIYEAMRRRDREDGVKSVKNPDEAISIERTILAECADAAYLINQEHHLGTISIGKVCNCVVYDKNFLKCDVETIPDAKLIATLVDGHEVYKG